MKIAMVFDGLQIGGIERVGADYAKILCELGHEVTIVNLNPSFSEMVNEFPATCMQINYKYTKKMSPESCCGIADRGGIYLGIFTLMYWVKSVVSIWKKRMFKCKKRGCDYDVVIAFAGHMNDLHFVSSGFINSKYKMCWLHGALYSYALMSRGYLREYKKIHNLVVLVDDAQEEVMAYNNLDLNINKLYNPTSISSRLVDDNIVNSLKSKYGKFAVMVSRFSYPHKDQYTVANAFKKVVELYNDDINLVFVGDGPEEGKVKEMVSTFPDSIRKRIYFEGAHQDVQNYYSAAHILLHASVAGEGLPTIMLEAMAYDLPMVVTDSKTGPREILQDNQYGLLCRVQDADDMANKIHTLLNDDDLYKNYQKKGKSRLKDFAPECISIKINEILNNFI